MGDSEVEEMLTVIFGRKAFPCRKLWRMMYWMPKFKHLSPWYLPDPMPDDTLELVKMAIQRITSVDLQTKITIYNVRNISSSLVVIATVSILYLVHFLHHALKWKWLFKIEQFFLNMTPKDWAAFADARIIFYAHMPVEEIAQFSNHSGCSRDIKIFWRNCCKRRDKKRHKNMWIDTNM